MRERITTLQYHTVCRVSFRVSYSQWKENKLSTNTFICFYSYSFAIVGINITDLAYNLLVSGALKTHFYNVAPEAPTLTHFQQTFCKWGGETATWSVFLLLLFFLPLQIAEYSKSTDTDVLHDTDAVMQVLLFCFCDPVLSCNTCYHRTREWNKVQKKRKCLNWWPSYLLKLILNNKKKELKLLKSF